MQVEKIFTKMNKNGRDHAKEMLLRRKNDHTLMRTRYLLITYTNYLHNWVITTSSLDPRSFRSKEVLDGDGSSGRSAYVARRRAFNRASAIIYCNKDLLTTFLTLTYSKQHNDYRIITNDLKNYFSRKGIQYIAVVEKHKSGMYHIHLLTSSLPNVTSLRKGKYSWNDWKRGFSDVKFISGTDEKFRVEKYIFKYMTKSEKIGGRYFLKSRGLTLKRYTYPYGSLPTPMLHEWPIDFSEYNIYNTNEYKLSVERLYYERQNSTK